MNIYRKLIELVEEKEPTVDELDTDHGVIPTDDTEELPKNNIRKYGRKFRRSISSSNQK